LDRVSKDYEDLDEETRKLVETLEELEEEYADYQDDPEKQESYRARLVKKKLQKYTEKLENRAAVLDMKNASKAEPLLNQLDRAIKKFNKATRKYEPDARAGEPTGFGLEVYHDVDLTPNNCGKMIDINKKGLNRDGRYESFTTSTAQMKASHASEDVSWGGSLDISYSGFGASGSVSKTDSLEQSSEECKSLDIALKYATIKVARPWLDYQLFMSDKITCKGFKAGEWSDKRCPYVIEGVVIAKDVKISNIEMS
jgi:hypothetical protein